MVLFFKSCISGATFVQQNGGLTFAGLYGRKVGDRIVSKITKTLQNIHFLRRSIRRDCNSRARLNGYP